MEYPNARFVNDVLFGVMEVVEYNGLMGQWATSWASSAHEELLATDRVREVSGCVAFIDKICKFRVLHLTFFKGYFAGGD